MLLSREFTCVSLMGQACCCSGPLLLSSPLLTPGLCWPSAPALPLARKGLFKHLAHLFRLRVCCLLACVRPKSLQSSPTLCDSMDCNLPSSSVHGIFQARIVERVAMLSSKGSSDPGIKLYLLSPALAGWFFTASITWEAHLFCLGFTSPPSLWKLNHAQGCSDLALSSKSRGFAFPKGNKQHFFPSLKVIYFNWRVITLQYCDGFCIHQYESAVGVHTSPLSCWKRTFRHCNIFVGRERTKCVFCNDISNSQFHFQLKFTDSNNLWENSIETSVQFSSFAQSCPILCNPIDGSTPGSVIPGILQTRTLEWVAISFSNAWNTIIQNMCRLHNL